MDARPDAGPGSGPEAAPEPLVATARRVVAETSTLLRTEAELARLETSANVREAGGVAMRAMAGLLVLSLALVFLVLAALVALAAALGWLQALLVSAGLLGTGGALLLASARRGAGRLSLLPERTLGRIAADLRAVSERLHPRQLHPAESEATAGDRA